MKKIILFIGTLIIGLMSVSLEAQGSWTQKASASLETQNFNSVVFFSVGNKGYYIDVNKVWEYDSSVDTWTQKNDFPGLARESSVGFEILGKGYIGTGQDYNQNLLNDFWEYNPTNDSWLQRANFGGGVRGVAAGFSINGKGYIGTGYDGSGARNDFWEYNPSTNFWVQKANFGGGNRLGAAGFSTDTKGYLGTGAATPDNNNLQNDFWEYNPLPDLWTAKANFIGLARVYIVSFSISGKGYLTTGTDEINGSGGNYYNFTYQFDTLNNSWTNVASYSGSGRFNCIAFSLGGFGYVGLGEAGQQTGGEYNDFWSYTPALSNENNHFLQNNIVVFPNPFSFETTIKTNQNLNNATLKLYNAFGQKIKEVQNISEQQIKLQRGNLSNGLYIVNLTEDNKTIFTEKLIIE